MTTSPNPHAYIYGLRVTGHHKYFYIGVTSKSVSRRVEQHIFEAQHGTHSNTHFSNKVKKHGSKNIESRVIKVVPYRDRWRQEKIEIEKRFADGAPLVNKVHVHRAWDRWGYFNSPTINDETIKIFGSIKEGIAATKPHDQLIVSRIFDMMAAVVDDMFVRFPNELKRDYPKLYAMAASSAAVKLGGE